ncbi:hypothetical protein B0H63DRAFT_362891, partial [Podospora didyma]
MSSFNPINRLTGRHYFTLFEIRLENDPIIFHGNDREASGQLLKGTVVLCLSSPLKITGVQLSLTGTLQCSWTGTNGKLTGGSHQRFCKRATIFFHRWSLFTGIGANSSAEPSPSTANFKGVTLPTGNYEWPFELMLPGHTTESIDGIREVSITYELNTSIGRGKFAYDLHASKRVYIGRNLALPVYQLLQRTSFENTWPSKVAYSLMVPRNTCVIGSSISLDTRFKPLLRGLELTSITARLIEVYSISTASPGVCYDVRKFRREKEIAKWTILASRERHWRDQEGWLVYLSLIPPKTMKVHKDIDTHEVRINHKLSLAAILKNPDGNYSEVCITFSIKMVTSPSEALPGYGEHFLDQLYEGETRACNLQATQHQSTVVASLSLMGLSPRTPSSGLRNVTLETSQSNCSSGSMGLWGGRPAAAQLHPLRSTPVVNRDVFPGRNTQEHLNCFDMTELSKVPSYQTAVTTPVGPTMFMRSFGLPDYGASREPS